MSRDASQIFAKRLKEAREAKGLSQAKLAELAGFQPSAISHFETGGRSPSFDNLKRLADALEVSTDWLLGREVTHSSGPLFESLFRHAENVSEEDLGMLARMAERLAAKEKDKRRKP